MTQESQTLHNGVKTCCTMLMDSALHVSEYALNGEV